MYNINLGAFINRRANAQAIIRGSREYPNVSGVVRFYSTPMGIIVFVNVSGLPNSSEQCKSPIFAFHIHSGDKCMGNESDPFAAALTHYNPDNCPHPYHAGDLPPLFSNNGYVFSVFLTDRVTIREIIGKTVIIHSAPDDFTSQPAGNSGKKIACGEIRG